MTLAIALDLPNQQTNLSLGLCDSSDALYARSLLEGFSEAPTSAFRDTWHYNQGVAFKDTLALSTARLGTAFNGKQLRLARALAFAKGVGSFSLGQDFDQSELTLAQSIQSFFNLAPSVFRFQAELFNAAQDSDAGNNGNFTGSWTTVNPDVDVQEQTPGGVVNVGWTAGGEWIQWNRPAPMTDGTYAVDFHIALDGTDNRCTGDINGSAFDVGSTGSWGNFQLRTNVCQVSVSPATTTLRLTFGAGFSFGFNLDYLELRKI